MQFYPGNTSYSLAKNVHVSPLFDFLTGPLSKGPR
jgi:hypothetical protein